jgi:PKD repeat protein
MTERFQRDHHLVRPTVEAVVVGNAYDTILAQQVYDVGTYRDQLPPIARLDLVPAHPDLGESFTLDASASDNNDGTIDEYRWDHGDRREGNYTVYLTVENGAGATSITNVTC